MERSILSVSQHAFSPDEDEQAIDAIVNTARRHNGALNITGALACTRFHFAQLIEGNSDAVFELMRRIERDSRHTDVTVLRVSAITRRLVPSWSTAYSGASTYVSRQITPLIGGTIGTNTVRVERLLSLLIGLASAEPELA